jgi:hypothetical protein
MREGGLRCTRKKGRADGSTSVAATLVPRQAHHERAFGPLAPRPSKGERRSSTSTAAALAIATVIGLAFPAAAEPPAESPFLSFRGRLEWLTAAGGSAPRDTAANPGNAVLALPAAAGGSELRPDLRLETGDRLRLVARPRLRVEATRARAAGEWQAEHGDATAEWLELFGAWRVDDRLELTYGLQNFQWGPGELMSPSNRLFHESGFARDPLYVVRGKHLVRVNASAGKAWSAVVLAEVGSNGEAPFVAGQPFEPKVEVKLEWAARDGATYLGLTGGAGQRSGGFFGEYGVLPLGDAISLYADAVHRGRLEAWCPAAGDAGGATFARCPAGGLRTLALGGVRWTFEGGADLRLEYAFDEAGWSDAALALAARAASGGGAPPSPAAVAAWLDPGFELLGRQHLYASLRLPDLPPGGRVVAQLRYLAALEDGSGAAFGTLSYDATDAVVLFASALATRGPDHGALSRLVRGSVVAGAVVTW